MPIMPNTEMSQADMFSKSDDISLDLDYVMNYRLSEFFAIFSHETLHASEFCRDKRINYYAPSGSNEFAAWSFHGYISLSLNDFELTKSTFDKLKVKDDSNYIGSVPKPLAW